MVVTAESARMSETKDSRAGRNDGKTYRFFRQLEAPPATAVGVAGMVASSAVPPPVFATAGMATPVVGAKGNLGFSMPNTEDHSESDDDDDMGARGKRKRSWEGGAGREETMRFLEGLMEQVMERQEAMQRRVLEAIEKREQDCVIREEAWRRQEMARLAREQEMLARERAMAATRNAAVVSLIQRITGQTIPMPSIAATPIRFTPPPPLQAHATPVALPPQPQPQKSPPPPQQQAVMAGQRSTGVVMAPHDAPGWPNAEVHALIQLRGSLGMPWKEPLWEEISAGMRRMGYRRSSKQCRVKWGSINAYFKKLKGSNKKRPQTWPYFHHLDSLYRSKTALDSPAGGVAFTLAAPISQRAPQPHAGGSVAGNRFVFSERMRHPAPVADGINAGHVQAIGLKQAPVAAMRLGTFGDVKEAARAYDAVALRLYVRQSLSGV